MKMEFDQIMRDLKNKIYHPVYFLQGEEPYFIDRISDQVEHNLLTEGEKSFNQTVLYGKDTDLLVLLDVLRRYPMMSNYQVVILKEAQDFKGIEKLESYFRNPMKSTIFVVCHKHKTIRKGTNFQKMVEKESAFYTSERLYDNQLPAFIESAAKNAGVHIDSKAVMLLAEYLGNDLSKIAMELTKLELNVPRERAITPADIEKFIGISKEYNSFELVHAIAAHNTEKAFRISDYLIRNPKDNPPVLIIGALYSFYSKAYLYMAQNLRMVQKDFELQGKMGVNKFMLQDLRSYGNHYSLDQAEKAIELLQEYDLKFKGVNATGSAKEELLTEMVFRLMN